jgi:aldehyde oxidoreductase
VNLAMRVNGEGIAAEVQPAARLSSVLRDTLDLKGTKVGCDAGDCGACSVIIDGAVCCGCLVAAGQVAGSEVVTIEGIAGTATGRRLAKAFKRHGAAQCGICTPGMMVSAAALLGNEANPTRQEVEDALGGVLCRCTGYRKIIDAVLDARGENTQEASMEFEAEAGDAVGRSLPRLDGAPKLDGREIFGADAIPDGAAMVRAIRSPHAAARFTIGDLDAFKKSYPGIDLILTAGDIPGRNLQGVIPAFADQPVLAESFTRFSGEAVAIIAGAPDMISKLDLDGFPVTWEPVEPLEASDAALQEDAPRIHENRPGNILVEGYVERGAIDEGFAEAVHSIEGSFSTPFIEHAYIEPEAGYAVRIGDRLEVHASTQAPHMDREALALILGIEVDAVRIAPTACGGGFGSKIDLTLEPFIALAAWFLDRPAYMVLTRGESMRTSTKRHPSEITARIGCDATGRITAMDFEGVFNTGAYASWGPTVANRVPIHASGPYYVPHYRALSQAVHTNGPTSGAFRGFGVPQSAIAQESLFHDLADKLGIDQLDFRLANALDNNQSTVTGQVFSEGVGIKACLDALRPAWERELAAARAYNATTPKGTVRRGIGIGTCWYGCGNTSMANPSTMRIGVTPDGRIVLHQGAIDIGQGSTTVMSQIAADALGIRIEDLDLLGADTDITPDAGKTSASRQTVVSGTAVLKAGAALRGKILLQANAGATAEIRLGDDGLLISDNGTARSLDLSGLEVNARGYVLEAEETYDPPTTPLDAKGQGDPYSVFGYGAQIAVASVDMALGTVTLERIIAAHDVGRAINPLLVEGQIQGGVAQGIGLALMEEYIPGRTENLHDYLIPTIGDVPEIDCIIVEVPDPLGPRGAKGLGEHVLIPTAPAVLNAIKDASGARIQHTPATPARVRAAIQATQKPKDTRPKGTGPGAVEHD